MIIDGTNVNDYGMKVVRVEGALDMPMRLAPYFYDWGDTLQPIVLPSLMGWSGRVIKVELFYNPYARISPYSLDNDFLETFKGYYAVGNPIELELTEATGLLGKFQVRVDPVEITRHKDYRKIVMTFYEHVPSFDGVLPTKPGTAPETSLGGYGLSQFGIVVESIKNLSGLGALKQSQATQYLTAPKKTQYRGFNSVKLVAVCIGNTETDLLSKMSAFQKLLSLPETHQFKYDGYDLTVFTPLGFSANRIHRRMVRFELTLLQI